MAPNRQAGGGIDFLAGFCLVNSSCRRKLENCFGHLIGSVYVVDLQLTTNWCCLFKVSPAGGSVNSNAFEH